MPECHSGGNCQDWYACTMYPNKKDCPYRADYEAKKRADAAVPLKCLVMFRG